jgi:hypothetical protein
MWPRSDGLSRFGKLHKYQRYIRRGARATTFRDPYFPVIYGRFTSNISEQPVPNTIRKTFHVGNTSYDTIRRMWRWYKVVVDACNKGRVTTTAIDWMLRRDVPVFCIEAVVYCERDHVNAHYGMIQACLALYSGFMDTISICGLPVYVVMTSFMGSSGLVPTLPGEIDTRSPSSSADRYGREWIEGRTSCPPS